MQVDEEEELSTSPYTGTKGQTWQQAVQYFEEIHLEKGQVLPLVAKHDTYGINFQVLFGFVMNLVFVHLR